MAQNQWYCNRIKQDNRYKDIYLILNLNVTQNRPLYTKKGKTNFILYWTGKSTLYT
jgi:hypothetical protein